MKPRYDMTGEQYKGNTHVHTSISDGGMSIAEVCEIYAERNYDFLCITDHWSHARAREYKSSSGPLVIPGIEIHGRDGQDDYFHVAAYDFAPDFDAGNDFPEALAELQTQEAFLALAHPMWSGNTFEHTLRYPFDAVEIYNHVGHMKNGKGSGLGHWDFLITNERPVVALACDDAHCTDEVPFYDGGWIILTASDLTEACIIQALRDGNFYSSTGPVFHDIYCTIHEVYVSTSPVQSIRLVARNGHGKTRFESKGAALFTEAQFDLDESFRSSAPLLSLRVEIEDGLGRRAWTNTLFTDSSTL